MAHDHDHDHEHPEDDHADELTDEEIALAEERAVRKRVALAQIRQYGDPVLRMRAREVESFDAELARTGERMIELMHDADGIGLAATQVGILRRLVVVNDDGEDRVLVNPVLSRVAGEPEIDEEGCLSLGEVRVPVERQLDVTVEAKDVAGEAVTLELAGISARVIQHELDHLDGTLIVDRTDTESRREALSRLRPRLLLSR